MAEITPIDPRENVTAPRIPRLPDLSGLAQLQKPRDGEAATVDGTGYVTRYLQEREDMAQDVVGGQQAMYFAPEDQVAAIEQARKEAMIAQLDSGEISMESYKANYTNQRPDNFNNIEGRDFERWLDRNLDPKHEASRGAIMAQFEPIYLKDFHSKFLEHRREYTKQAVHTTTTETLEINKANAGNYLQNGFTNREVAGLQQQALLNNVAAGISSGNPVPPNVIMQEQKAINRKLEQANADIETGRRTFAANEGVIAGAAMYQVFSTNDTESQMKNNSYAWQAAEITGQLSGLFVVSNATSENDFVAFKIAQNTGLRPQDINPVGKEAGKNYDLTGMREAIPGIVDSVGDFPVGMSRKDRVALAESFLTTIENKIKTADGDFEEQSIQLAETYSNYAWNIMQNAKLDTGGMLMQNEKDAARSLIDNMQVSVDREESKGKHIDPIIARLKSAIDYMGPGADDTPDDVKIGLYMAGLEGYVTMLQAGENQMDFRDILWKNTKYEDGDNQMWDMTYPIWHEIQGKIDLMAPFNDLWNETKRLVSQTNDPVLAGKLIEMAWFESTQLYQGTYLEDVAVSHVQQASLGLDREAPKNRDFKPGGEIVWKINTGEVMVNLDTKTDVMNSIQDIGNFDKQYLGSMLSDDGFAMASHYEMFWDAYSNAGFNDEESGLYADATGGNLLGRALGYDDKGQPLVAVRSGDFVTTSFGGQSVDAYKVDVFDITHNKLANSTDLDPDSPALRLHGGRERGRDINYYMVRNPQTKLMEIWTGVIQTGTAGRQNAIILGESISSSMGINGDLMSHLHNTGIEGSDREIVPAQQTLETDASLTFYINKRESEYIGPEGKGNLPAAVTEHDEKYMPLPNSYEYVSMFYGTDEFERPIVAARDANVDRLLMDAEEAKIRNLMGNMSKAEIQYEETEIGNFIMPTQAWRPTYKSLPDREGTVTTVDEEFTDTEWTEKYGMLVRVPPEIAADVKMLFYGGKPNSQQEAFEFYEFYLSQKRQGGLR